MQAGIRGGSISNAITFKQIGSGGGYLDFGDLSAQVANTDAHVKWSWRFRIMSDIKINNITDRTGDSGPIFAGISTVSTDTFMVMPSGPTEYRGGRGRGIIWVNNATINKNT